MAQNENRMKWDPETGSISLIGDGKEERIFVISRDFMGVFIAEMLETSGKSTFKITMRKLMEKLGKPLGDDTEVAWELFEKYNDEQILPVSTAGLNIPKEYAPWDGKTRNLTLLPDIPMVMWTVKSFLAFKDVMEDVMTEKGATALLQSMGKKAGMAIGVRFAQYFGWSDLTNAVKSLDEITQRMFPAVGWSKGNVVSQTGKDGKPIILIKSLNSYETFEKQSSHTRPFCTITAGLLNGIWNTFADSIGGQAAEAREVKCSAKGDAYCAFVVKIKDKGTPPLDWKELEAEWQAIDK
ncbi:MAG TPA: 4-vinyl reductase [Candidatus Kapabacteria bacterium]|nr:4-vinyl reductase [Candidatus Kapabacteria bacterium]